MKFLYFLIALFALAVAEPEALGSCNVVDVSNAVDNAIPYLSKYIVEHNLDPLRIPDINQVIQFKVMLIKHTVNLALTSGNLTNLSTVHRDAPATLLYRGNILTFTTGFAFNDIAIEFNYFAEHKIINSRGILKARAASINGVFSVDIDLKNYRLLVKELSLNSIQSLSVDIKGDYLYDWIKKPLINKITPVLKEKLFEVVRVKGKEIVQTHFDKINAKFPHTFSIYYAI